MKFRKRPVVIDAVKLTESNVDEVLRWIDDGEAPAYAYGTGRGEVGIRTLEGVMTASVGDWIIRGVQGEHYPCKPDIFEATYEPVK